jgi:hypothetical protein
MNSSSTTGGSVLDRQIKDAQRGNVTSSLKEMKLQRCQRRRAMKNRSDDSRIGCSHFLLTIDSIEDYL